MEIGSPEDGFDEISAILKDHESTLTEDLDLSFIISKDFSEDYVYDDSTGIDKFNFHLSEQGQSELPSLSSNLGCYDIPGSCTETLHSSTQNGCHNDGLGDANVIDDQKSNFEPWEDQYSQDAHKLFGHYLGDSAIEMGAENVDDEILMDVCLQAQGFVPVQDNNLEEEVIEIPKTPPHNEISEKAFLEALEQELNQDDTGYNEEAEHEFQVDQLHKFHSASSNQCHPESKSENVNDSRTSPDAGKKVESAHVNQNDQGRTSQVSVSPDTSSVRQITDDHRVSASNGHNDISYPNTSPDQIYNQDECYDQNGRTLSMDRLLHAGEQNCASSWDSGQRSQHLDSSSGRYVATPRNHHRKRSRSRSPRLINSRSRRKREISTNSQESSPYSRESCKKQSKKAAGFHPSPRSQNISSANCHKKVLYSSRSCKRKYGLAGSSDRGREVTSKDHLLDSGSQKLSFQHESNERFLNVTSNHVHASSINHHSHHTRRKVESSVSPSSVPRRDHCFGYKREHSKARSRSPYGRNRQSPRKRYTSRLQSPSRSYISRRRSPEIRYLSQASCSRTGIGKPGTCLFVAGFRFLITERELERKFSPFGCVSNVRIIRDKRSRISRGYGFLSLEGDEEADAAIRALHRTEWNGRVVLVEKSVSN